MGLCRRTKVLEEKKGFLKVYSRVGMYGVSDNTEKTDTF
jgi:hypothetical protein